MAVTFQPLHPTIGVEVKGVDLANGVAPELSARILELLGKSGVVVFRGQCISDAELVAFGRGFGELEVLPEPEKRDGEFPEIFALTNVRPAGGLVDFDETQSVFLRGTQRWHTDSSYRELPCLATMLYGIEVPSSGGQTQFADMCAAYESLPTAQKHSVDAMRAVHSYEYSRSTNPGYMPPMDEAEKTKLPPVVHPLVRTHRDGRKSLYMGTHASHIEGMGIEAGRSLLAQLLDVATRAEHVYEHEWQANDLVMWDNRCTLHRSRPYDITGERRVMRRITVTGTGPVV